MSKVIRAMLELALATVMLLWILGVVGDGWMRAIAWGYVGMTGVGLIIIIIGALVFAASLPDRRR